MGIFTRFFNRENELNKNNSVYTNPYYNNQNQVNKNNEKTNLELNYNSGTKCKVEFLDIKQIRDENGNLLTIQEVKLEYIERNNEFSQKIVALDPQMLQDENGNYFYATEEYYKNLANQNISLVKGFFQKDQINKIENGYIGYIGFDEKKGTYNRSFNTNTKLYYDKILYDKNKEKSMQRELREKTYRNEIEMMAARKEINIDTNPERKLTQEDYEQYYGNR